MTLSAAFTIESTTVPQSSGDAVEIDWGDTVDLALLSTTGLTGVTWSIFGLSANLSSSPTITPAGTPSGATASFTADSDTYDGLGAAYGVCCEVTDGNTTARSYGIVGVPGANGSVPYVAGEELARHATQGWTRLITDHSLGYPHTVYHTTTTDATIRNAAIIPIPTDQVMQLTTIWSAKQSGATDRLYHHAVAAYRNDSGTVTIIGSQNDIITAEDDASWNSAYAISGTNVNVQYQGDAAANVDWMVYVWAFTPGN